MKYTKEQFENLLQEKYNEPFEIVRYYGTSKAGTYKCGYCQQEYSLSKIGKLLNKECKHICPHCFDSSKASEILKVLAEKENLCFVRFSYKQNLHKPTVIYNCKLCQEETEKPYIEFLKYPTCIHCGINAKRRTVNGLRQLLPKGFELLGKYEGKDVKTLFRHQCGFAFKMRPHDLLSGHSYCPKCSKKASKGERKIMEYLMDNEIDFIKEKVFDWSDHKRYDFYLPQYNLLIEYHGIQHYKEIDNYFLSLEEQQTIDKWKESQAKQRKYNYLVISYENYENIFQILAQRLKENT